jgi:hypothetical protein
VHNQGKRFQTAGKEPVRTPIEGIPSGNKFKRFKFAFYSLFCLQCVQIKQLTKIASKDFHSKNALNEPFLVQNKAKNEEKRPENGSKSQTFLIHFRPAFGANWGEILSLGESTHPP